MARVEAPGGNDRSASDKRRAAIERRMKLSGKWTKLTPQQMKKVSSNMNSDWRREGQRQPRSFQGGAG